jgi:DNA-binding response OmpR family regulator
MCNLLYIASQDDHIARYFQNHGFDVKKVASANELVQLLRHNPSPAGIILSEDMPDNTRGSELIKIIRIKVGSSVRIVLFADAPHMRHHVNDMKRTGIDGITLATSTSSLSEIASTLSLTNA